MVIPIRASYHFQQTNALPIRSGYCPNLDLCGCLLAAATFQIQACDTCSQQHHRGRLGNRVRSGELKLDAVIPEVAIGIESKRCVVAVQEIGVEYLQLVGGEIVNECRWCGGEASCR